MRDGIAGLRRAIGDRRRWDGGVAAHAIGRAAGAVASAEKMV
jgi:hypothetical protein